MVPTDLGLGKKGPVPQVSSVNCLLISQQTTNDDKGRGWLAAKAPGKRYFEVVPMGLHAPAGRRNSNVLINRERGSWGLVREGWAGAGRGHGVLTVLCWVTICWVRSFMHTSLFFNVHDLERLVSFLLDR